MDGTDERDDLEQRNYLIISDLHLRGGWGNTTPGLHHFDEDLVEFLLYYRLHRRAKRPWTLVLGGDSVEFLYVTDLPNPSEPLLRNVRISEDDVRYGLDAEAGKARWKLDVILRSSHPRLLAALARFVADGNDIVVLRGNHDVDLFWVEVQEHLRRLITEYRPADLGYNDMKRIVASRVRFPEWFFYVPGRLYVEHGSQYDAACSFEYFLAPVVPERPGEIDASISDLATRYFTNQIKVVDAMSVENAKSLSQCVPWLLRADPSRWPRIVALYVAMVRRVLARTTPHAPQAQRATSALHTRHMRAFERAVGLPSGTAKRIDDLSSRPTIRSRLATARFLALDLVTGVFASAAAALSVPLFFSAKAAALSSIAAATLIGLAHAWSTRLAGAGEANDLRKVATRIVEILGVDNVVFGHSHDAGAWPLAHGATYLNVGTQVRTGEDPSFVYAVLEAGQTRAYLLRWNEKKAAPDVMDRGAAANEPIAHGRAA